MDRTILTRISDYVRLKKSLRPLQQSFCLNAQKVASVLDIYWHAFAGTGPIITKLVNGHCYAGFDHEKLGALTRLTLLYFADRVLSTPLQVIHLIYLEPFYASSSAGALNRNLFESIVNYLYIASEEGTSRFVQFLFFSLQQDHEI